MIWYQIRRAFAFGRVKHPDLKPFMTWVPRVIGAVLALLCILLPVRPPLTGDGSVSRHMLTVFAILPGFYIAALSAVATFSREEMDFEMPDPAPRLTIRTRGRDQEVPVTFRMFLSHMFAYLTALSFLAVFIFVAAELISPSGEVFIGKIPDNTISEYFQLTNRNVFTAVISGVYLFISFWFASKIVLTTMIGLYFLAERIHRPNA